MLSALSEEQADYLVVGAYAVAAHGLRRATKDLDVWIRCSPENAAKVWRALAKFGAPLDQLSIDDLQQEGVFFQIGLPPNRIDLLTAIDAVTFNDAWERKQVVEVDGVTFVCIGFDDLIKNKQATGRGQDRSDAERLLTIHRNRD